MMRLIARMNRLNVLVFALLCCLAWQGIARAQEVPFTGIVVEDSVSVRAGAGRAYYVVGELKSGAIVQVEAVIFGWNKIKAPLGVHSYISKAFVDAQGDGKVGTVNSDRVEVKAASLQGPGPSYRGQVLLNKGDKVQIVASEGSYYKILPPADAFVFLPPGAVRRASGAEAAGQVPAEPAQPATEQTPSEPEVTAEPVNQPAEPEAQPAPAMPAEPSNAAQEVAEAVEPAAEAAQQTPADEATQVVEATEAVQEEASQQVAEAEAEAEQMPATQPQPVAMAEAQAEADSEASAADPGEQASEQAEQTVEQVQTTAVSDQLRKVELQYLPVFNEPVDEQPIGEMIAAYEAVGGNPNLPRHDQRIVRLRLAALKRNKQIADALAQIKSLRQASEVEAAETAAAQPVQPANYDAVGKLMASSVYDGQTLPRMYRLVDPASGRTLAYLQPNEVTESRRLLGKVVGIEGPMRYDPALKLRVIEVKRIDLLEAVAQ